MKVTVGGPHASEAATVAILGTGTVALHPGKTTATGHVIVGGVASKILVIVCVHVAVLPHASAA